MGVLVWNLSKQRIEIPSGEGDAANPPTAAPVGSEKIHRKAVRTSHTNTHPYEDQGAAGVEAANVRIEADAKERSVRELVNSENVPIYFHGRVVDQEGNPIIGAQVLVRVRQWSISLAAPLSPTGGTFPIERKTGTDGSFRIDRIRGDGFDIRYIRKEGYQLSPRTYLHSGPVNGTPENPVMYRMWKVGQKEKLVSNQHLFGVIPDGRKYSLDLLHGKTVEGIGDGDLRISIIRPEAAQRKQKFKWSFRLEGVDGGLIETNDEFMYLAPESGYKPTFEMSLVPSSPEWTALVKRRFFFRSRDAQVYGRLEVEIMAIYNEKAAVEINFSLNPSGSRNLQP